jgi:hypothetical protein
MLHVLGDRPDVIGGFDSSRKPRVTAKWRDAVVISSAVNPVSEMMVDAVLFTMPPWQGGNAGGQSGAAQGL